MNPVRSAAGRTLAGRPLLGWVLGLCVLAIWSGWVVISRLGVTGQLTAWDITALRFAVAAVVILPWALSWGLGGLRLWQALWLAVSTGAPYAAACFLGFHFAPAAHGAVLINGTIPLFTLLLGWLLLRHRPQRGQSLGVLLVLGGCFAIGGDGLLSPVPDQWKGHLLFLLAALLLSGYMIAARRWHVTQRQALAAVPLGSALLFLPVYLLFDLPSSLKHRPLADWPWGEVALQAGFQGVIVSLLALVLFTRANALLGSTALAAFVAAVPAVSLLLAIPVLGEVPSALAVAGVVVVTLGVACILGLIRLARPAAAAE
ncbi:MAG TPA: EamA family transporter [Kiloniellales bacterium]|nr:EamA family transporter [Kiloniellales bacterium]